MKKQSVENFITVRNLPNGWKWKKNTVANTLWLEDANVNQYWYADFNKREYLPDEVKLYEKLKYFKLHESWSEKQYMEAVENQMFRAS